MAVMGDASAEVWTDELRRAGRVVFPVRRRRVVIRWVLFSLPVLNSLWEAPTQWDEGGADRFFSLLGVAAFLMIVGIHLWQSLTRQPELTVDDEGIHFGRKRFLPWTDIGTIGIPTGPKFFMLVPVLQNNVWAKELRLPQDNVKDIPAFARWLEQLLAQHRAAARRGDGTSGSS
jgi:hypothetical protein